MEVVHESASSSACSRTSNLRSLWAMRQKRSPKVIAKFEYIHSLDRLSLV
ncbi:hypothetical protein [Paenibacillus polymyxa]|nr:hypothetical protein [Paenibacillus polymyxa]WDZ55412.1 hypothetical protein MF622_09150 [Paenibacillus polymyxa]